MRLALFVVFAWITHAFTPILSAQSEIDDQVDQVVLQHMQEYRVPGLALAVVQNGQVIKGKGYGFANIELQVPVTCKTIFQSGSVGKQFTATAVMMLVEEGKIRLEDTLERYFPDAPHSWSKITIQHLLTHTSGLKNYTTNDFNYRLDYTEDELLRKAQMIGLEFEPGEDWHYSNTGYVVLGILIHKVTGQFYGDFLQERIFTPLNMTSARIISESDIVYDRSSGYCLKDGQWKNQAYVSPTLNTTADGSLYLSVLDLAKWDDALYTEKLLKQSTLYQMWTVSCLNNGQVNKGQYGFGWSIKEVNGNRLIEHRGAWQGFTSMISRYVDEALTVIVLTNLAHSSPDLVAHDVAALYSMYRKNNPIFDKHP